MFIAKKGPECFNDKKDAIMKCMIPTFIGYIPTKTSNSTSLPNFILGEKECADMKILEHCIVKEMRYCNESAPADFVESLLKYVKKDTPCNNAGQANTFSMHILIGIFLMTMLVKVIAH